MKVAVLGAGVAGVAAAYYLWRDGHEVVVLERRPGPALETSFGNAGGLCPSFAGPWAAPGMVGKVLKMALQRQAPIRFSLSPSPRKLAWLARWLGNCNAERFRANKLRMQRVAHYSAACLRDLAGSGLPVDFDYHQDGTLQVFRTEADLKAAQGITRALDEYEVPWQLLDGAGARRLEPALAAARAPIAGALYLPLDGSGDSHKFSTGLAAYLAEQGVSFQYGLQIRALAQEGGRIQGVQAEGRHELITADAYVVALGPQAPFLLRPLGLALPVYPLKGYSITARIDDAARAPRAALMDEYNKVMISRLGDRVRAAGMAELKGYGTAVDPARVAFLQSVVREWFPEGIDLDHAQAWAGLRPMTPDGPAILGKTRYDNLYLDCGHGSNGWTQACGTGKIVADIVAGREPEVDLEGLTAERFA
ncbi:D-amino acid dehydrogenase [Bordetella petrii]|uniref:D-amino acid dehydrogenase, small subunit n=1 Tax=Bordetella petrii (strain ATCC BAA-461 / DSM 12804 / CCUG 43448 / CIP 107267 / Se-1111R) TaxID=340100 RepID=A9I4Z3_BORPD|nr:D-amino acid dehydrogenase [Bordetella petrii]CAP41041.1 D-amino acid dehydrogenase, small subunit [Bordetella petrii]